MYADSSFIVIDIRWNLTRSFFVVVWCTIIRQYWCTLELFFHNSRTLIDARWLSPFVCSPMYDLHDGLCVKNQTSLLTILSLSRKETRTHVKTCVLFTRASWSLPQKFHARKQNACYVAVHFEKGHSMKTNWTARRTSIGAWRGYCENLSPNRHHLAAIARPKKEQKTDLAFRLILSSTVLLRAPVVPPRRPRKGKWLPHLSVVSVQIWITSKCMAPIGKSRLLWSLPPLRLSCRSLWLALWLF